MYIKYFIKINILYQQLTTLLITHAMGCLLYNCNSLEAA